LNFRGIETLAIRKKRLSGPQFAYFSQTSRRPSKGDDGPADTVIVDDQSASETATETS
jgi:hypothetical protein